MRNYTEHLVKKGSKLTLALNRLESLAKDAIIFVVNDDNQLLGSLTDGDVRRGLLKGLNTDNKVEEFIQSNPRFIRKENYSIHEIIKLRENNLKIIPVLNGNDEIVNVINFRFLKSYLPFDAVIMAGGRGKRLKPLTDKTPKPLLKIGDKSIIEHGIDRLRQYGVDDFWISLRYLGEQIQEQFKDGYSKGISIEYIWENEPLGTIGAISNIQKFKHPYVLVTNSDILTTIDYEDFFLDFLKQEADMAVVSIPYKVDIPYAVLETQQNRIHSFKEKPTYTYFSNGGIYLFKSSVFDKIPPNSFFNSTDLMEKLIDDGLKVISYPLRQYWLDIGKPADFEKAQEDIKHLNL